MSQDQVAATVSLLDDGATVPFIARYRKESTAGLDEVAIISIRDRLSQIRELRVRRAAILESLEKRGLLVDELLQAVTAAQTMAELEDIYLPYRPKRRTRATIAKEKGLEPLAARLWGQQQFEVKRVAAEYIDANTGTVNGVSDITEALSGARDIIAEWISEDTVARREIRRLFWSQGTFSSLVVPGKREDAGKFQDYFDWQEPVLRVPSHRVLAMLRGEKESMLSVHISPPTAQAIAVLQGIFVTGDTEASHEVSRAVQDRYKPLLGASMEAEVRREARHQAQDAAISLYLIHI